MFKKKKSLILVSLLLVLALTLVACGESTEANAKDPEEDTLVVAQGADVKSLDPHATNDQPSSRVNKQIYDTLIYTDEDMELEPGLAKEWDQLDDNTWEFKLEEGVQFHNGEELTADDVKFTLDRMMDSSEVAHIIGAVESVEVEDDYTVIIKTEEPFSPLLSHLAHTAASILNEKAVEESGDDYQNEPVGTGPYKLVEHESGDKVILERFDDYYREPAKVKNVEFRNVPEGTNRVIGLETEEIDIAYEIEPVDRSDISDNDDLELIERPSLSTSYIGFNTEKEPYDDVEVRQALNHAIDVDEIIDVVLEGAGTRATGPINDKVFGYDESLEGYEYDPEKAKEMLAEAGYPDGLDTTIWTNDSPVREKIAEVVQGQLKEVGVNAEIETLEWATYLERTSAGEHDMFILGWVAVTGDADYGLYALFHSSQHGGAGNRTFYDNPEVDELLDKGRVSTDEDERLELYKEAQKEIVEDAPQLFLYFEDQNAGVQNYIEGFELNPAGHHSIYEANFK
ncbi:MAG TPA: glutathione ABC transporter substrate-binding protein [Tissierellaceae bacterium]|nr:glutathione ABC transporter substrate-binding protein [Tissierellaceae bacterium]